MGADMIEKNTVSANRQVQRKHYIERFDNGGRINVLFLGNSITRHEPKSEIGWENDWGMAASKRENDYVHVTVRLLEEKLGKVNYCVANCGEWEMNYYKDELLSEWKEARDFCADIVVVRLGENIFNVRDKFAEYPLAPHYEKLIEYFSSNPKAKVIVTGLFWKSPQIEEAIEKVVVEKGYAYAPLNDLSEKEENMAIGKFWHNGVAMHPGDLGMQRIAERIVKAL